MIHEVVEFNRSILGIEPRSIGIMPSHEVTHLEKCLREEAKEFENSFYSGDLIGMIDSLIDSIYFGLGGLYKMGLTPEAAIEIFSAVHDANMNKKKGIVERRAVSGAVDAVKPDGWVPPEERISLIIDKHLAIQNEVK